MLVFIFLLAVITTASDEGPHKILETFSQFECPDDYEYCTKRHECLSVFGCRTSLESEDCPKDSEICDPSGSSCWKENCQDVRKPCSVLCNKKLFCPKESNGPSQCYEVIECQPGCEVETGQDFELSNEMSEEEYYEYPEFPFRVKREGAQETERHKIGQEVSIDTKEMDACPPGTEFCLSQGLCLAQCPKDKEENCPSGTYFCFGTNTCQIDCKVNNEQDFIQCSQGTTLCLSTMKCSTSCEEFEDENIEKCPPGLTFCLDFGGCAHECQEQEIEEPHALDVVECPPETFFCLDRGICSMDCSDETTEMDRPNNDVVQCPTNMVYCLDRGLCMYDCNYEEITPFELDPDEFQCPTGMTFCLDHGLCLMDCNSFGPTDTPDDIETNCPEGMSFCLEIGHCSMDCHEARPNRCPSGMSFCPELNKCSTHCSQNQTTELDQDKVQCPLGLVFCPNLTRCLTNCQERDRPPLDQNEIQCPNGMIYCLGKEMCAFSCENTNRTTISQKEIHCPIGMIYCLDKTMCAFNCGNANRTTLNIEEIQCPISMTYCLDKGMCVYDCQPSETNNADETGHCPFGMTFCLDQGMCVLDCNPPGTNHTNETMQCPIGMTFCFNQTICSWNCSDNETAPFNTSLEYRCLGSMAFCLSTRRCETNCSEEFAICPSNQTFCNATKTCGTSCFNLESGKNQCPSGQIFCSEDGACHNTTRVCSELTNPNDSTISCPFGTRFCLGQERCVTNCGDKPEQCPDGTKFCRTTGLCTSACLNGNMEPECPEGIEICNEDESDRDGKSDQGIPEAFIKCPPNTIYCLEAGECLYECNSQRGPSLTQCPQGLTLCLDTLECRTDCSETPISPPDKRQIISCPIGTHFCLEQMSCQKDCHNEQAPSPVQDDWQCPPGTTLCLDIGKCSSNCDSQRDPIQLDVDYVCPPGIAYCLSQGLCTNSCHAEDGKEEDGQSGRPIREISCPPGTSFCLELNQCLAHCSNESPLSTNTIFQCPPGTVYCLESHHCATDCRRDKDFGLEQGLEGRHSSFKPCPRGYIYCLAIDACVLGDCSVFETLHPNCTSNQIYNPQSKSCEPFHNFDSNRTYLPSCGEGKYFCGITDDCLPMSEPCDKAFCPWGTVLCNGQCSRTCSFEDVGCPIPRAIATPEFTSCMVNQHCEPGYLCCKDSGKQHRHCVKTSFSNSTSLVSIPGAMALQQSCTAIAVPKNAFLVPIFNKHNCSGLDSTDEPWKCPTDTLCCDGTCWGLPSSGRMGNDSHDDNEDEIRGPAKRECSGRDIYCPSLKLCLAMDQLNECSKMCPEKQTLCQNGLRPMKCSTNCSDEEAISRIWITSKATDARNNSDPLSLKLLVDEYGNLSNGWSGTVISSDVGWEFRDSSSTWQKLEKGSILSRETWLQYRAKQNLSSSGSLNTSDSFLRKFKMKLEGTPNQSDWFVTLAQLELPLLPARPILAGNSKSTHITPEQDGKEGGGIGKDDDDDQGSAVEKVFYAMKEDSREPVRLSEVFKVVEDPKAINILRREYQRSFDELQSEGLWRLKVPGNNSFAGRFLKTFKNDLERIQRPSGVKLEFAQTITRREEYRNKVQFSLDNGLHWNLMENPQEALYLPLNKDTLLLLDLEKDYVGQIAFNVTAYLEDLDGLIKENRDEKQTIIIQVTPVNDAPQVRQNWFSSQKLQFPMVPHNLSISNNSGILAKDLAEMFYESDAATGNGLGLAILGAVKSKIGRWQVQSGDGWIDISAEPKLLIPEGLITEFTYRGPLPVTSYMKKLACKFDDESASLTSPNEAMCWNEMRKEACPEPSVIGPLKVRNGQKSTRFESKPIPLASGAFESALEKLNQATSPISQDDQRPARKRVTAALETQLISVFLVEPSTRIRYEPFQADTVWTTTDAIKHTRISFTAWDGSTRGNGAPTKGIQVSAPFCCDGNCDKTASLSRDFSVIYIEKEDCNGAPISNSHKRVDDCGVCGGKNSCKDCSGTINGGDRWECGQCVKKGQTARDCGGSCDKRFALVPSGNSSAEICVSLDSVQNGSMGEITIPGCDGVTGSKARVNRCGICGTDPKAGLNECGECGPLKHSNECKCGEQLDICGKCRKPKSQEFDVCDPDEAPISVQPNLVDLIRSNKVFLKLAHDLIPEDLDRRKSECFMVLKSSGAQVSLEIKKAAKSVISVTKSDPTPGQYQVSCSVTDSKSGQTIELTSIANDLKIVNTESLIVEEAYVEKNPQGQAELHIVTDRPLASFEVPGLTCFCRKVDSQKSRTMSETQVDLSQPTLIHCGPLSVPPGEQYQCGVVLNPEQKVLRRLTLPSMTIAIDQVAPKVRALRFREKRGVIVMEFDMNVEGPEDCSQIFTPDTMQILQLPDVDPIECQFKTNRLKIKLNGKANSKDEVPSRNGTSGSSWRTLDEFQLKFLEGNGIRAKGANIDYCDEFSSGTVLNVKSQKPSDQDKDTDDEEEDEDKGRSLGDFSWSVPSSICYGSALKIKSQAPKSFGQSGDKVEYVITESLESSREGRANESKVVLNGILTIANQRNDHEDLPDDEQDYELEDDESEVSNIDDNTNNEETEKRQGKSSPKNKKRTKEKNPGKIRVRKDRIVVKIPVKKLDPGVSYKLNLRGLSNNISTTTLPSEFEDDWVDFFQTIFTVASADQSHIVNVAVPGKVFPDRQITLKAMLKDCSKSNRKKADSNGTNPKTSPSSERWKFFWSTDGKINFNLANQDLQRLRLPRHSLEGGREYTFFVEVVPELNPEAAFQNQLSFTVEGLGLKAQFAASELTFGIQNEIVLDGSLSRDLDNLSGNLTYDWFCMDELTSQPCYALDVEANQTQSSSPILLKEKFKENMSKQVVLLPGLSLAIGRFYFRLCISKDTRSDCARMIVEIKPGKVATIQLAARDSVTNPAEETIIKALVTGSQGTCVHWECVHAEGFAFIDLTEHTKSAQVVCFTGTSSQRGFHLVIPGGVLEGKTRYKFRLVAKNPLLGTSDASTVITTLEPPNKGTCEITPTSGVAMNTTFVLDCHSFNNMDHLIFNVEFADLTSEAPNNFVHLDEFLGSETGELNFLASPGKIQLLVTICTFQEVCDELLLNETIQVDKAQIDDGTVRSLGIAVANEISQKEPLRALSLMRRVVLSVSQDDGNVWNKYKIPVCSLQFGTFREATAEFIQDLVPSDVPIAVTMLDLFLKSPCWNVKDENIADERRNALLAGKQLSDALGTLQKKLQPLQKDPSLKEKLRRKRAIPFSHNWTSKLKRLKRSDGNLEEQGEGHHKILTFFDSIISPEQMEVVLQFSEMAIGGDVESEIQAMRDLLDQIHSDSMKNLCRGTTPQSDPRMLMTDTLEISMKRTEFMEGDKEKFGFGLSSSTVKFDDGAIQKFSEWNCLSSEETDPNFTPCIGLCIGTALFENDYVTPTSQRFNVTRPPMKSNIHDIRLLNPQTGNDLTSFYQTEDLGGSLQIQIEVHKNAEDQASARQKRSTNPSISTGYELKCMVFHNDNWTSEFCETKEFVTKADGTATMNCDCSVPGYVAVFLVSSGSGENVTLKVNEVRVFEETITITFLDAYKDVVGENEEGKSEFITSIRNQMASLLTTDVSNIQDVEVWEGSTVVKMQIVGYDEQESAELEKAYRELAQKFERGEVKMTDQNGRPLTLQPQCVLDSCRVRDKESETKIFYIIAGVALAITLFVIILIIMGVIMKNKKRTEKVKPFMNSGSQPPTYRTFQFADSLEGTKVNYRGSRKPVPAPYLPSNSNYSDMQRSQILEEDSKSLDSGILIDREHGDVPNNPARYKKPSKEDLAKTQPISEDIIKRVERRMTEKLPGTPE